MHPTHPTPLSLHPGARKSVESICAGVDDGRSDPTRVRPSDEGVTTVVTDTAPAPTTTTKTDTTTRRRRAALRLALRRYARELRRRPALAAGALLLPALGGIFLQLPAAARGRRPRRAARRRRGP